jgi:putative ABC transport system ATP-binding protein
LPTEALETTALAARCEDLTRVYRTASGEVRALTGLDAEFTAGHLHAVVGPSGSGKSSLLRLLAGLDRPTDGVLLVEGTRVHDASSRALRRFRRTTVGYLFQRPSDNFMPHLTVREHLDIAGRLSHRPPRIPQEELLSTLGIADRIDHRAAELSGGEQQRAAIAEVLMGGAQIVVADEPTAELDSVSATHVMDTIGALVELGVTFVVATHDRSVMERSDATLVLEHGVRREGPSPPAATLLPARDTRPAGAESWHAEDRGTRWRPPPAGVQLEEQPAALAAANVSKTYVRGDETIHALDGINLTLASGEMVGLVGRSGSGKTTLLNVIAGWERPDVGVVERIDGAGGVPGWDELAVVPQKLGLLEELTVRENVEYPARLTNRLDELRPAIDDLLEGLGIAHLERRYPKETSLGEQQRTAVARAVVLGPRLLLADEPTGHQDAVSADRVMEVFARAASSGTACLIATHNEALVPRLDRALHMSDGHLTDGASAA